MANELPDRLSINPRSPHYNEEILKRNVGIRFNGSERTNVEEYCVSERWIRVAAGRGVDRHGNPLLIKMSGNVEPYFKEEAPDRQG
jgi:predicted house-cleaning NTP pyrophosphatase (Maf/HAM1 superfamily)